ncbi:hypothetical protein LCGC14_2873530 [marine sediment metagenome]|uniref:Uncharacterized protein n=1 Tax=marine sediment metagenome TaxID=412755 RepID=A0A0F8Y257_9ZZZZ
MEENQKKLYDHYKAIASNEIKDSKGRDLKVIVRENAAIHAADILKKSPNIESVEIPSDPSDDAEEAPKEEVSKFEDKPKAKGKKASKGA